MAPSSDTKPQGRPQPQQARTEVSLRIPPGQEVATLQALERLEVHVLKIAPHWSALTPEQRQWLLEHSPVLARFVRLAQQFRE